MNEARHGIAVHGDVVILRKRGCENVRRCTTREPRG